jgi:hypothetical protein
LALERRAIDGDNARPKAPVMSTSISPASNRRRFLLQLVVALTLLPVAGAFAQQRAVNSAPAPSGAVRLFYASHSLMWYVPKLLPELAAAAGIQGQEVVGVQAIGASRTLQHWEKAEPNQAKAALQTGKVDVFVMSPIQFPDEGVENFVKLGLEHNPGMHFIVQLSWGGGDTDNQDFPKGSWDNVDRNKTPEQLKKLYERNIAAGEAQAGEINRKYGKGRRILTLVPTAQALVVLRSKIYQKEIPGLNNQAELFVDAAHPSAPLEVLNTYLHFAVLYGRSPVGLPLPGKLKSANREGWDDKLNRALQEIAWQTAASYPYSGIPTSNAR